jgi:formate hydrogenlyase subunit 4
MTDSQSGVSFTALAVLLIAAPIIPGVASRTKAILTGRQGSPVWQLYADLWKLAQRGTVLSTRTTWIFQLAPVVLLATTIVAAALVPLDGRVSIVRFAGDAVAFAGVLGLGRFALSLAALDTGSSLEGMGASREVTFASLAEPGLFVAFATLGVIAHDFSLSAMLGDAAGRVGASGGAGPSLVMVALSVFALSLAECSRVPVDDPSTHLELTMVHEVMVLDHSGPDLAMILYAGALKLGLFSAILMNVLVAASGQGKWSFGGAAIAALVASFVGMGVSIGVVESIVARLRQPKVPLYLAGGSALALFGLILVLR